MTEKLSCFLSRLFAVLTAGKRCFSSGSFVIGLEKKGEVYRMMQSVIANGKDRLIHGTHRAFMSPKVHAALRACGSLSGETYDVRPITKQKEILFPNVIEFLCKRDCKFDVSPVCLEERESKRVMLTYLFESEGRLFAFCKLESAKAISIEHVKSAVKRYVLHKHVKQSYTVRREDTCIDHKPKSGELSALAYDDATFFHRYLQDMNAESSNTFSQSQWYTDHVRVGAEVFIPNAAAELLLETCSLRHGFRLFTDKKNMLKKVVARAQSKEPK